MKTGKRVHTSWEVWTYDVWGNKEDDWTVNNRFCVSRDHPISCPVEVWNEGTSREFLAAYPSNTAIRAALGITGARWGIAVEGDDLAIYVSRADTGYPLGELYCTSHESLSPIQEAVNE